MTTASHSNHSRSAKVMIWLLVAALTGSLICNGMFVSKQQQRDREVVGVLQRYLTLRLAISNQHEAYVALLQRLNLISDRAYDLANQLLSLDRQETEARLQALSVRYPKWIDAEEETISVTPVLPSTLTPTIPEPVPGP